jgi:hypothetical protein
MGEMQNVYKILVSKTEGKRPCERFRHRWEDNVRMDLREIGWEGVDWMHLSEDNYQCQTLMNTVMNLRVP